MNLTLHFILFGVLALVTVGMFVYRRWLENHDDPYIHLHNDQHDSSIISTQTALAKRLDTVDKAKNALVVALIVYAVAIAAMAFYTGWNASNM